MSEPNKTQDAPAATPPVETPKPAADATPPATPSTPPKPEVKPDNRPGGIDPVLRRLFDGIEDIIKPEPAAKPPEPPQPPAAAAPPEPPKEGKVEAAPAPAPTPPPAAQPEPPKDDKTPVKPATVRKKEDIAALIQEQVDRALKNRVKTEQPVVQPPPQPPPPTNGEIDTTGWDDDEIEALNVAKFAETADQNYKGKVAEVVAFKKRLDEKLAESAKDENFDPNSDEFVEWLEENKPQYRPGDLGKFRRGMVEQAAVAKAEQMLNERLQATELRTREIELRPVIENITKKFVHGLNDLLKADDTLKDTIGDKDLLPFVEKASEIGIKPAVEGLPLEDKIAVTNMSLGARVTREFVALETGLIPFNPNEPMHSWLYNFVQSQDNAIANLPDKDKRREGKTFVTRTEFLNMKPEERAKHFCFETADYVQMLALYGQKETARQVKAAQEEIARMGYVKAPSNPKKEDKTIPPTPTPTPASPPQPESPPPKSPKAGSALSPGAAPVPNTGLNPRGPFSSRELELLGLKS